MVKRDKANYMIQSVSHAVDVLEELCKSGGEVGVTELAKRLKLHKNNVFRLLATLELRGYVEQNRSTEDYCLAVRALQLGQAYLAQNSLVKRAQGLLEALVEDSGETVSLAVLRNFHIQYPVSVEATQPVRVAPRLAVSFSAKQCAIGRLLLAQESDAVLDEFMSSGATVDSGTNAVGFNAKSFNDQKAELREKGLIVDKGQIEKDVVCIGKVVRGNGGIVIGAVEMLAPVYRASIDELVMKVDATAQKLSVALGAETNSLSLAIERDIAGDGLGAGIVRVK
jgi:IclR family KDG regulon transcriptional repressor